jgi:fructose-bisphosphate aldolase class I
MNKNELQKIAKSLVASQKGLLAADESTHTIEKRFTGIGVNSTPETHRKYRQMLFTTPNVENYLSGIILYDETVRQKTDEGIPFPEYITKRGIIPGIKVDEGKVPFKEDSKELVTKGIKGLSERLKEYKQMGLKFTKWRGVVLISHLYPTEEAIRENGRRFAEYAYICQENGFVPIVEPEVLMDGEHTSARDEEITTKALKIVFEELDKRGVYLEGMLLKTNMVMPGKASTIVASPNEVAGSTLRALKNSVPEAVPGVVFLSGGQSSKEAIANLNEINLKKDDSPWELSFSFGRALQMPALKEWGGKEANEATAQKIFEKRAKLASLARQGKYSESMEQK